MAGNGIEQRDVLFWHHVSDTFTVIGHEGIPLDEAADAIRQDVGDADK